MDSPQLSSLTIVQAVAMVATDDVWAVGYYTPTYQGPARTQILHWDGLQWSVVTSPNVGSDNNFLAGVTALAADDVWAVGYYLNGSVANTLILHWDGATWSQVPSPNVGAGSNALVAVTARAADDVWAVGDYGYPASQTLVLHWDGAAWTPVSSPNPSPYSLLTGITALSSTNAWAVGYSDQGGHVLHSLILHWDGNSWAIVPSPNPGTSENILAGIAAVDAADIWAVGEYADGTPGTFTLMLHWNGAQWETYPSTQRGGLNGAYAVTANDVWAVGTTGLTLITHWDGAHWDTAYSPNPGYPEYTLRGVDGVAANDIWAVGAFNMSSEGASTLTEHYTGGCVTPTATATSVPPTPRATATLSSATATASPSTTRPARTSTPLPSTGTPAPSSTATPPTSTATTTPAYCQTTFTDVPPGSPFYSYIRCLACSGIINGYRDNTFRPNNNVTRGQLAKIAANAAGFTDPQTTQLFQDVPPGSPFFTYIGRLAARGFISGYACGGPGEPCTPPGSLPYFRPNTGATRGQIAKIVANAAGFNDMPGGRQFADVPPGSPYYTYIYRLVSRAIISGYSCGGTGEPCLPPDNLPYFRSNTNATRGQTSKIVANTFSRTCPPPAR